VTYTDSTGGVANPTTITLNTRGETPNEVWLTGGVTVQVRSEGFGRLDGLDRRQRQRASTTSRARSTSGSRASADLRQRDELHAGRGSDHDLHEGHAGQDDEFRRHDL
jgi:hypothetical protein